MKMKIPILMVVLLKAFGEIKASCTNQDFRRGAYYSSNRHSYVSCTNITIPKPSEIVAKGSSTYAPKYITFSNSSLTVIPVGFFSRYATMSEVYLNGVKVNKIEPGAFNGMPKLERLELHDNNITEITRGSFNSLTALKYLDLSGNSLTDIEDNSLHGLSALDNLKLNNNNLSYVNSETFSSLNLLKTLDLSYNYLSAVDNYTFKSFPAIRNLNLSFNEIKELDCNYFPPLLLLNVSYCKIDRVKNFFNLQNISFVDLKGNNITELSPIGNDIIYFNFGGNNLRVLAAFLFQQSAPKLKSLGLSYNILSEIDSDSFSNLKVLEYLYLNNNMLTNLPIGAFKDLISLKYLFLSFNHITQLDYGTFAGLLKLEELYLDHNKLIKIEENSLHVVSNIKKLILNDNAISFIEYSSLVTHLTKLSEIDLNNNNWTCDDLLGILRSFTRTNKINFHVGDSYKVQNVHGIKCNINRNLTLNQNTISVAETTARINDVVKDNVVPDFTNTSFYKYFNHEFFESSFFKYFNNSFHFKEHLAQTETPSDDFKQLAQSLELIADKEQNNTLGFGLISFLVLIVLLLVIIVGALIVLYRLLWKHQILLQNSKNNLMYDGDL